jgi:hypothetical protein
MLVWVCVAWWDSDLMLCAVSIVVTIVGLVCSRYLASHGQPNVHHASEIVFLALKPPFDLIRNLFGIILVPDEMRGRVGFTCKPIMILQLPEVLRYGSTRQFGVCHPEAMEPIRNFTFFLSLFGIGPACVWTVFSRKGWRMLSESCAWLKLATIYGLLAFFVAPAVSFWLERDIGYSWPLFWLALPALLDSCGVRASWLIIALLFENLMASWIPYALDTKWNYQMPYLLFALAFAVTMQCAALWTLHRNIGNAECA